MFTACNMETLTQKCEDALKHQEKILRGKMEQIISDHAGIKIKQEKKMRLYPIASRSLLSGRRRTFFGHFICCNAFSRLRVASKIYKMDNF